MRLFPTLVTLAALALATPAGASPHIIPQPWPEPLGVLVADAKTIHVLRATSVLEGRVTLKTEAKLKGDAEQGPFGALDLMGNAGCEDLFHADDLVLCFRQKEVAVLHVGGRWALAVEPEEWRDEKNWFCLAENHYGVIFEGATGGLREHVAAILAGRETTLTARMLVEGGGLHHRLCRIKAGPKVTDFALSDESPHFVGWGTGDPDEVTKLVQSLRPDAPRNRAAAAADLADLGPAARPALPALRRALRDRDPSAALAAAVSLARLDEDDKEGIDAIRDDLADDDPEVRYAACKALGQLGPRASAAIPELLCRVEDKDDSVRAAAANALGSVAPAAPTAEMVAALTTLLKDEKSYVRCSAIHSLESFGPRDWSAMPTLWKGMLNPPGDSSLHDFNSEAMAFLSRFDPPPVEMLAEIVADRRFKDGSRQAAARKLGTLGSRAQPALPALRRALLEPEGEGNRDLGPFRLDIAVALLAIDPEGGPAFAQPVLLELAKGRSSERLGAFWLLGRCGPAARPAVHDLVKSLDSTTIDPYMAVDSLTPLLDTGDRELLPSLQKLLSGDHVNPLCLAKVLHQLGRPEEALKQAAIGLESDWPHRRAETARWLGQRGQDAGSVVPALRRALDKSEGGVRARIALTLVRVRGLEGTGARARALTALADLLAVCEWESPGIGPVDQRDFWSWQYYGFAASQEEEAVGAAVGLVHSRLEERDDPLSVLTNALEDHSPHVRLAAAVALARAEPGHKDVVPTLRRLLERHPHFFAYAADTLAALGPTAAPLGPQMLALSRHPNDDVARTAGNVLRRIDPALAAKTRGSAGVADAVPEDLNPLWDDLAGADPLGADLAVWRLAGAGSRAVALVRERLRPLPSPSPERVAHLIGDLNSDDFDTRERASTELAEAIEIAAPALRKALAADPAAEQRRRIDALLGDPNPTPEQRRRLRAVRVLEGTGVAEARTLLKSLAEGDERFCLTGTAAAALRRLDRP